MPIVKVELFPGRSPEKKAELAKAITDAFERIGGITPAATTVIFVEVPPNEWFVGGDPLHLPPINRGTTSRDGG